MTRVFMIRSHYPDVRLEKEADVLIKNGYDVTLLCWDRGREQSVNSNQFDVVKMDLHVPAGSVKVAFYLPIWWSFVIINLILKKWDIVHAADFDAFFPALPIAKLKSKYIIYDIFDFYADTLIFPILPKILRKVFSNIDLALMKYSDFIVLVDESRLEQIHRELDSNIEIIYNSPESNLFDRIANRTKKTKFNIFYGGVVYEDRFIDGMIECVKDCNDVDLMIMGFCGTERFRKRLIELGANIENIKLILKSVPHQDIIDHTISSDLLFAIYDPRIPNNRYASPNKLFEAMAAKRPIIVSEGTSMADIVRTENCGLVIPYGDIESLKNAIISLKNDSNLRTLLGSNGKKAYDDKYGWAIMEKRLLGIYEKLARSGQLNNN